MISNGCPGAQFLQPQHFSPWEDSGEGLTQGHEEKSRADPGYQPFLPDASPGLVPGTVAMASNNHHLSTWASHFTNISFNLQSAHATDEKQSH